MAVLYLIRLDGQRLSVKMHDLLVVQSCEQDSVSGPPFVLIRQPSPSSLDPPHHVHQNPSHSTIRLCLRVDVRDAPL